MAKTAREIMSGGVECVGEDETILDAARKMRALGVGVLPICGKDDRLKGMLTERDIVVTGAGEGPRARGDHFGRAGGGQAGDDRR